MIEIEIGKEYLVEHAIKKSVTEVETYEKEYDTLQITTLWRGGEFVVTPQTEEEVDLLEQFQDGVEGETLCMNDFEEMEMSGTFDGCSVERVEPNSIFDRSPGLINCPSVKLVNKLH